MQEGDLKFKERKMIHLQYGGRTINSEEKEERGLLVSLRAQLKIRREGPPHKISLRNLGFRRSCDLPSEGDPEL